MIHSVGDSHSRWTFLGVPGVDHHWLGPITMHRVGRERMMFVKDEVPPDGITLLCFGEIDVRCHITRLAEEHGGTASIVMDLATAYVAAAEANRADFPRIAIMSVVPPTRKDDTPANASFPYHGSDADRSLVTKMLNADLRTLCSRAAIPYLDVHSLYADADGMLSKNLSDGNVHIGDVSRAQALVKSLGWI